LESICSNYLEAANWLSEIIYQRQLIQSPVKLHGEFYSTIRGMFDLPSQVVCSLFRAVVGSYKAARKKKHKLIVYKKQSVPLCWTKDFNITERKGFTVFNVPSIYQSKSIPEGKWCDSKLKKIGKSWYICLCVKVKIPEPKSSGVVAGIDSGIKNICTVWTPKKTLFVSGSSLNEKRKRIRQVRSKVASVGTPSSKKLLKRLSQKESSVTQQHLHVVSRRLVDFAEQMNVSTLVFEDLRGIRKGSEKKAKRMSKENRATISRWPFAQLQFYVEYKAAAKGISVEYVDPKFTSQECSVCGYVHKSNRKGIDFICKNCGHQDHADRNGAINIASRSIPRGYTHEERAVVNPLIVADI
jgi:IS605 OrfB family transposase